MQSTSAKTSFFITVTDIQENTHVTTVFFSSLLELQLNEARVRKQYNDDHLIVTTHPSNDQVRSSELSDVYYQVRMQSLILHGIRNQQPR